LNGEEQEACLETAKDEDFFVNLLHLPVEERRLKDVQWRFTRLPL